MWTYFCLLCTPSSQVLLCIRTAKHPCVRDLSVTPTPAPPADQREHTPKPGSVTRSPSVQTTDTSRLALLGSTPDRSTDLAQKSTNLEATGLMITATLSSILTALQTVQEPPPDCAVTNHQDCDAVPSTCGKSPDGYTGVARDSSTTRTLYLTSEPSIESKSTY